jgi:hypothetical protein
MPRGSRCAGSPGSSTLKVKFHDIEIGLDLDPEAGLADNGDLEGDLTALFEATGLAAKAAGTALLIFAVATSQARFPHS